jgi:hypothetical protein
MEVLLLFNPYPFISFTAGLLILTILVYLLSLKQKTRATWLFVGMFASLFLLQVVSFLTNAIVFWGRTFWLLQIVCGLVCAVFALQFAYHFPQCDQPKEARWMTKIVVMITFVGFGYSLY